MKTVPALNKSVMIAAVAATVAGYVAIANAAPTTIDMTGKEKCYGVAKAGHNDCAGGGSSCNGTAAKDGQGFLAVPKGLCEKLSNGSLTDPMAK